MSTISLLIVIAVLQAAVFVALLVVIVLNRWARAARGERLAGPTGEVERAIQAWMLGTVGADWVLARLARLPPGVALDLVVHYSSRVPPDRWRGLAEPLSRERWVHTLRAGAGARRWTRRLDAARVTAVTARPEDETIIARLLGDSNPAVVVATMSALERVTTPGVLAAALARLPGLPRPLQAYLAASFSRAQPTLVPLVNAILQGPRDRPGLNSYVDLAGRLGEPGLRAPLAALHDHPDAEIRTAVARALGRFPNRDSVRILRVLAGDSAWPVRAQAVASLSRLGEKAVDQYATALRDPEWWVRLRGAVALGVSGGAGRDALLAAEVGAHGEARDMARFVLGLAPNTLVEYQA